MNGPLATGAPRANLLSWWAPALACSPSTCGAAGICSSSSSPSGCSPIVRLFVHHTPSLPVLFNWTPSLPYRVVYVDYGSTTLTRGDLVVYAFEGEAARKDYPGLKDQPSSSDRRCRRRHGHRRRPRGLRQRRQRRPSQDPHLRPPAAGADRGRRVIPPGFLYVQGTSPDSFDSRYRASGLVAVRDVPAKVRPLF